jgi:chromosome transmission fidelity protein 4
VTDAYGHNRVTNLNLAYAMSSRSLFVNSAHPPGLTVLAFSRDGQRAYTGGTDCIVRIWHTGKGGDHEPDAATQANGPITSLCDAGGTWLSASEDSDVRSYIKHKPELKGLLTGVGGVPVRCVAVDPKGTRAAVTSE